jgi:hypothetical protein
VSDNTKVEMYPLSLNLLYSVCPVTITKQWQQLSYPTACATSKETYMSDIITKE